jgi:hypothetical protein
MKLKVSKVSPLAVWNVQKYLQLHHNLRQVFENNFTLSVGIRAGVQILTPEPGSLDDKGTRYYFKRGYGGAYQASCGQDYSVWECGEGIRQDNTLGHLSWTGLKGTVQRKLRGVKLYISRFVSLWAMVASLWFCQKDSHHFEIHEKHFSVI